MAMAKTSILIGILLCAAALLVGYGIGKDDTARFDDAFVGEAAE